MAGRPRREAVMRRRALLVVSFLVAVLWGWRRASKRHIAPLAPSAPIRAFSDDVMPVLPARPSAGRRSAAMAAVIAMLAVLPAVFSGPASASSITPVHVNVRLEGCRASVDAYLPGGFVCPDPAYTTGNLGSGWNELDLVP